MNVERIQYANLPQPPCLQTGPYVRDDGHTKVSHVGDDLTVLRGDLGMLDEFV